MGSMGLLSRVSDIFLHLLDMVYRLKKTQLVSCDNKKVRRNWVAYPGPLEFLGNYQKFESFTSNHQFSALYSMTQTPSLQVP